MITRRDVVVGAIAVGLTMAAVAWAQSPAKPVMRSSVFDWEKMEVQPQKYGARRHVFDSRIATLDRLEMHITTVNPGQASHEPHQHFEEELIIVKEGTIESMQNGERTRVGPGSVIFESSNELHGMRNVGDTPATYYVLKWWTPKPAAAK